MQRNEMAPGNKRIIEMLGVVFVGIVVVLCAGLALAALTWAWRIALG